MGDGRKGGDILYDCLFWFKYGKVSIGLGIEYIEKYKSYFLNLWILIFRESFEVGMRYEGV